ncbi:uncharacterized protein [Haliotis asinina]|uniref:uncharacterized protein n=1 Tax=Haliotis asinina TaxID=109174 RepID=UPI00353255E4
MVLLLLVTLSCLAAVKGQPTPCCMQTAWSAKVFDPRGPYQGNNINADFYYDYDKAATAIQYTVYGTPVTQKSTKIVTAYLQNARYTITGNGTCTKDVPTDVLLPKCIPNDSEDIGSSYIGIQASGMKSNNWVVVKDSINITMSVTDPDCVLTYLGITNPADSPTDTELYFNGFKTGITDPDAFDVPISCQ